MTPPRFLIIDGYPEKSRQEFDDCAMRQASRLYADLLHRHLPEAEHEIWLPSDSTAPPGGDGPERYQGILWTGCNLTIYHQHEERVACQLAFAERAYEAGTPGFGSCWGLQIAAVAAGGEVKANPRGREMGLARKIRLTEKGLRHPMMAGKPPVYSGFISHIDEVTRMPPGGLVLASNDFTVVQALAVTHRKGTFWATQYHPEYDLHEMARLITTREKKLLPEGFFTGREELNLYVDRLEALHKEPGRKDLRWQLGIDDDVLSDEIRQLEFANWLKQAVCTDAGR